MKKLFIIFLASVTAFAAISWTKKIFNAASFTIVQDNNRVLILTKNFNTADIQNVKVSTSGGSIRVAGDASNSATIEVYGQGNNGKHLSKDEIQQILNRDYDFSVVLDNGTLKAIAKRKVSGNWKNAVSISFEIHVAKNVATDLNTSGGSISLASLHGDEKFNTSGGSIHFENLSGNIDGNTSGGSISANNSEGNIKAQTSGGSLSLDNLKGNIQMSTSGGSIHANNVDGSLDINTSGGSIDMNNITAKLNASTSGGSIRASLNSLDKDVALSTSGGSVNVTVPNSAKINFELKGSKVNIGAANNIQVNVNKEGNYAKGSLNGGGANLVANTSSGNVNLKFN